MILKKYKDNASCIKCGAINVLDPKAISPGTIITSITTVFRAYTDVALELNGIYKHDIDQDVMIRTCTRCGFQWLEKPLEAKGSPSSSKEVQARPRKSKHVQGSPRK